MRHCYGSYWLAVHKDRAHLAELIGTSLEMIKTHYKRAIPQPVAKGFWKLAPGPREPGKIISISAAAWSRPENQSEVREEKVHQRREAGPMSRMEKFPTLEFRFARTTLEIPHEYVVRSPENEVEYAELFRTIAECGQWETFVSRRWYPGDGWKYWRMGGNLSRSKIINLAKVECAD